MVLNTHKTLCGLLSQYQGSMNKPPDSCYFKVACQGLAAAEAQRDTWC